MRYDNRGLRDGGAPAGHGTAWQASWLVTVLAIVGCTQQQAPKEEPAASPATESQTTPPEDKADTTEKTEHASHEKASAGTLPSAEVAEVVTFIRANASRRQAAAVACRQMQLCTHFQPADRGGEQGVILSIPEDAKDCVLSRNPECQSALDQIQKHPAPEPIRADYVQWAYTSNELALQTSRLALELMEQRKLKVKKEGDGYQDFWTVWAAKHFPEQSQQASTLTARADATRQEGEQNLERWLTQHGVCAKAARCTPAAVENGVGLSPPFQ